jgi:putative CocE/NonD family hydrolase
MLALVIPASAAPVTPDMVQTGSDITGKFVAPRPGFDYELRVVMVPMRDGVKLNTVILIPNNAKGLPIIMERTPYNASGFVDGDKPHMRDAARGAFREYIDDGYIIVVQDIRGKHGSKGDYVMTRPPMGPLNPSRTDDTTDAYDTIEWLTKNIKQSNGRVGMIGSSYDGWTVAMALLAPHPALKAAVPESPMIDGWMGDDWYHYGAFRQNSLDYYLGQTTKAGRGESIPRDGNDDYRAYLEAGSAGAYAEAYGLNQLPWWKRVAAHPAYDAFWQLQALDKLVAARPANVPTIWLQGLWDQEDMYGAIVTWEALKKSGHGANNHLVMGPWYHSQINRSGETLAPFKWNGDTAADFRKTVLLPFFNAALKDRAAPPLPEAMIFNASEKRWESFADWPVAEKQATKPLYLKPGSALGFDKPASGADSYISDPAKPVPFVNPPVDFSDHKRWTTWLLEDQRWAATRPDVLVYQTPVLTEAVKVEGAPFADLFVKTTGTDADFVVKIIDVYPATYAEQPELGGYQLPISQDIFRGRYRNSFEHPEAFKPGETAEIKFRLPTMNYSFKPGHRIMVQIQSTQFPLYDRNPQTFVPNILFAKPSDFQKATITVELGSSAVLLPVK